MKRRGGIGGYDDLIKRRTVELTSEMVHMFLELFLGMVI